MNEHRSPHNVGFGYALNGTLEGIRTPDTRLRRAVLYPAELLARMQFLFVSVTPAIETPPNVRRRSLYTTDLQGHMQKYSIVQFRWTRDCQMLGGDHSILNNKGG